MMMMMMIVLFIVLFQNQTSNTLSAALRERQPQIMQQPVVQAPPQQFVPQMQMSPLRQPQIMQQPVLQAPGQIVRATATYRRAHTLVSILPNLFPTPKSQTA